MKRILSLLAIILLPIGVFAQEQPRFWDDPINHPLMLIYLVTTFIFIVIVLVMLVAIYMIKVLNMLTEQAEKERAQKQGIAYVPRPSWWDRVTQQLNASVPVEQEKDIELHHSYDGIKELDNHLPPWWKYLFYGTIGWSVIYLIVYHFSATLPLQLEEYQNEVASAEEQARIFKASQPQEAIDESKLVYTQDAAIIEKGKSVFMNNNCGSCHRNDGGGNSIGPNLTDEFWLHGGDIKDIFKTVKNGVVEKGMPAWGKALSPQDVRAVTFFILSLQGTNPANGKAPQGEIFKQTPIAGDSTTNAQAAL